MAAGASDRYYYGSDGQTLGPLEIERAIDATSRIGLVDEWLGLDAAMEVTQPTSFWIQPIQTVSQSESGFELVHQSCSVTPHWQFTAPADGRWTVTLTLSLDTSAAQARELSERGNAKLISAGH
jgi:alpha-amylase